MKKTFVKPEMKCHKLRASNILAGSPCPTDYCLRHNNPSCGEYCPYNCITETCGSHGGGEPSCKGHYFDIIIP